MDKKNVAIGILLCTAALLLVANVMSISPAKAEVAMKDRNYSAVTTKITTGGDGLYVLDNASGQMAIFIFDANTRTLQVKERRALADAFQGGK